MVSQKRLSVFPLRASFMCYLPRVSAWETPSGDELSQAPPIDSCASNFGFLRRQKKISQIGNRTVVNNASDGGWRTQISEESHLGLYVLVPHCVSFLNKFISNVLWQDTNISMVASGEPSLYECTYERGRSTLVCLDD